MGSSANPTAKSDAGASSASSSRRQKVNRRDPEKRKEQNRQSQKTYREKQKRRLEELERLAALNPTASSSSKPSAESLVTDGSSQSAGGITGESLPAEPTNGLTTSLALDSPEGIDPSLLLDSALFDSSQLSLSAAPETDTAPFSTSSNLVLSQSHTLDPEFLFLSTEFDRWLLREGHNSSTLSPPAEPRLSPRSRTRRDPAGNANSYCHNSAYTTLPASIPSSSSLFANNLRIDTWCVLSGLLENCLHLGVSKAMFCADDSQSPFYRINNVTLAHQQQQDSDPEAIEESQLLVKRVRSIHGSIKYDLRPIDSQILKSHHPYIDVLPFRDLRENLIALQFDIDEDNFLYDFLTSVTCWGTVRETGSGSGCPWDGRSWEASEKFLRKWWHVVGGEDGELTRTSRWWKAMRGERVTEVY